MALIRIYDLSKVHLWLANYETFAGILYTYIYAINTNNKTIHNSLNTFTVVSNSPLFESILNFVML